MKTRKEIRAFQRQRKMNRILMLPLDVRQHSKEISIVAEMFKPNSSGIMFCPNNA